MLQPDSLPAFAAWLLGLVTLAAATASDIRTLEVEDWVRMPALMYGIPFTAWSTLTGRVNTLLLALAAVWIILGLAVFITGAMGRADGLAVMSVALLTPQAAFFTLTYAFIALIVTHISVACVVNLTRQRRDRSYTKKLKKLGAPAAALLLTVAVTHPAPFHPEAGGKVYSEKIGRFTWFTDTEKQEKPREDDWVQLPMPAIPFLLASYATMTLTFALFF